MVAPILLLCGYSPNGGDLVVFGSAYMGYVNSTYDVLAVTDGSDAAYLGSWGATKTPTTIPALFFGSVVGGTSADMTTITGFSAGSGAGNYGAGSGTDAIIFTAAAWNGASSVGNAAVDGDLVDLGGDIVLAAGFEPSSAQLSAVWVNSASNNTLQSSDNVLLYAPSDASVQSALQLAVQLHTASDAVTLPAGIPAGQDRHILVAYNVGATNAVNIADVDLVNSTGLEQTSTAGLHVYASDMVHLTGVSLASLAHYNIAFIQ